MQLSTPPTLVPLPFADGGAKNVIPENPSATPGLASLQLGFPPVTMTPLAAGGIPPAGQDMNGVLNLITQSIRWANAGGGYKYSSAFATDTNVNGYPAGAVILRGDGAGYWLNLADNNTTDPENSPSNWAPLESYGITAVTGLTNANVTLTPAQYGLPIITLAGTLTGNVQIIFPALKSQWKIVNATTGAFTVTCKTASGTGVIVAQGGEANVYGDGTNIVLNALQIAPATQSQHAMQLGQATGRLLRTTVYINNAGTLQSSVNGSAFANASSTFTPLNATAMVEVEVQAGGGAGGGAVTNSSTTISSGAGGAGGGYARAIFTSGFSGQTITVGAGGQAVVGAQGNNGSSSSFGSLISATGGVGGSVGPATSTSAATTPNGGANPGVGSGGQINASGGPGAPALYYGSTSLSGNGGSSNFGSGPGGTIGRSGGSGANSLGAGGSGGNNTPSGAAVFGGNGAGGVVIVREYA